MSRNPTPGGLDTRLPFFESVQTAEVGEGSSRLEGLDERGERLLGLARDPVVRLEPSHQLGGHHAEATAAENDRCIGGARVAASSSP